MTKFFRTSHFFLMLAVICCISSCSEGKVDGVYIRKTDPSVKLILNGEEYKLQKNDSTLFSGKYEIKEDNLFLFSWEGLEPCGVGDIEAIWLAKINSNGISISPKGESCFFIKKSE